MRDMITIPATKLMKQLNMTEEEFSDFVRKHLPRWVILKRCATVLKDGKAWSFVVVPEGESFPIPPMNYSFEEYSVGDFANWVPGPFTSVLLENKIIEPSMWFKVVREKSN